MNSLHCIFVFTFLLLQCQSTPSLKKCRGFEECINIANCPSEMSKLVNKSAEQITKVIVKSMRKKVCGFDSQTELQIKVCCPRLGKRTYLADCKGFTHEHMNRVLPVQVCGMNVKVGVKIRGGKEVKDHTLPWMAQLHTHIEEDQFGFCGGTLISRRFILTAAHCFDNRTNSDISKHSVILGSPDNSIYDYEDEQLIKGPSQIQIESNTYDDDDELPIEDFQITKILIHPKYQPSTSSSFPENDIALLILDREAEFSESVQPICLPLGRQSCRNLVDNQLIVSGWGLTDRGGEQSSVLRKASVKYVLRGLCSEKYRTITGGASLPNTQICAGGGKSDACEGDSGGPIQLQVSRNDDTQKKETVTVQYGITSYGLKGCTPSNKNIPGVYTRIVPYLNWIIDTMMENSSPEDYYFS